MFPLASVQRKEETLFVEIDNYLDDSLTSRLPSAEQQPIVIENLEDSIEAAFRRYIPDPDRYDEVFTRSIEKASELVEERFSKSAIISNCSPVVTVTVPEVDVNFCPAISTH